MPIPLARNRAAQVDQIFQTLLANGFTRDQAQHFKDFLNGFLPKRIYIAADTLKPLGSATLAQLTHNDAASNALIWTYNSSQADGDEFTHGFSCQEGIYTFNVRSWKSDNRGIVDVSIDDKVVTSINMYATPDEVPIVSFGGIVLGSGQHKFGLKVNGKDAASSSYYMAVLDIWAYPTAGD